MPGFSSPETEPAIELRELSLEYSTAGQTLLAISGVTTDIRRGEFVSILGPSGCGKTSLLRLTAGLIGPTRGAITVAGMSPENARRKGMFGMVFQRPFLFEWRTVLDNILLPAELLPGRNQPTASGWRTAADKILGMLDLQAFAHARPSQLSGGMQARVALARALIYNPEILLMDEPFGSLDELTRIRMNLLLLETWSQTRCTVVFVTHSVQEAVFLSDRVCVLSQRPGMLVHELELVLPRPRKLQMMASEDFTRHADTLRKCLGLLD